MVCISYLANRRHAQYMDIALFARRKTNERVVSFFCHQLRAHTRSTHELAPATNLQFNVMDSGAGRNILQRQRITNADISLRSRYNTIADTETEGCNDVALLPVKIMQKCYTR